jgi:hypothetical protein
VQLARLEIPDLLDHVATASLVVERQLDRQLRYSVSFVQVGLTPNGVWRR